MKIGMDQLYIVFLSAKLVIVSVVIQRVNKLGFMDHVDLVFYFLIEIGNHVHNFLILYVVNSSYVDN